MLGVWCLVLYSPSIPDASEMRPYLKMGRRFVPACRRPGGRSILTYW